VPGGNGCLQTPPVALWCRSPPPVPSSVTLSATPPAAAAASTPHQAAAERAFAAPAAPPAGERPDFPATAPAANPVFYRTYSRKTASGRESWHQVVERNLEGLRRLGHLNDSELELLRRMQLDQKALPSGRWLWIGGTAWIEQPVNFSGAYN